MDTTTARHSLWLAGLPEHRFPRVTGDASYDVVVIGAGITGVTTALLLKRAGVRVALVEAARVACGVSGNNTAKVTALQSTVYSSMVHLHGKEAARDYAAASAKAVETVAELAPPDADLRRLPACTYALDTTEVEAVEREAEAATAAGLPVVLDHGERMNVPFQVHRAVRLDDQLAIHPVRYVHGLARRIEGDGSRVFEGSRVLGVDEGDPCRVHTPHGVLTADRVVVATHYPILDRGLYFARLEPTRAYCVAARIAGEPPTGLAISAGSPSWSLAASGERLIVAGQSHPTGKPTEDPYGRLADFARKHWNVVEFTHRWSAQDPSAYDRLPMIGPYTPATKRLYGATGYMKWGLSSGTFAALILADLLTDRDNPWADRFTPHRVSLSALPALAKLNAKVAVDLVGDRLKPADTKAGEDVPRGQARVVEGKVGVYRDDDDTLHAVSLRCTHLGCLVRFNDAERSWDCPCHGSRFDVDGDVLEGPATKALPRRDT